MTRGSAPDLEKVDGSSCSTGSGRCQVAVQQVRRFTDHNSTGQRAFTRAVLGIDHPENCQEAKADREVRLQVHDFLPAREQQVANA